jgi:triphosphoribosyl-dephospho-CoA synthase
VYLAFLARIPDTHLCRKFGSGQAETVRAEAGRIIGTVDLAARPVEALLRFDTALKECGLNPGTSADFTVATLFADTLEHLLGSLPFPSE